MRWAEHVAGMGRRNMNKDFVLLLLLLLLLLSLFPLCRVFTHIPETNNVPKESAAIVHASSSHAIFLLFCPL
jgi:hypothetical protein